MNVLSNDRRNQLAKQYKNFLKILYFFQLHLHDVTEARFVFLYNGILFTEKLHHETKIKFETLNSHNFFPKFADIFIGIWIAVLLHSFDYKVR